MGAGDVLWVHAGQVHRGGAIADIEGSVAMFGPHTVDECTRDLIRSHLDRPRSHWPAADLTGTPVSQALALFVPSGTDPQATERTGLRQVALAHGLAALLVQLALVQPAGATPAPGPTHEAYTWFRDHIEEQFRSWHKVSQYADASVSDIAEQLGFDDASNFSSYFRRQTRLTPGTFRTQSRSAGTGSQEACPVTTGRRPLTAWCRWFAVV